MKLRDANESLKKIDGRIRDLDSDGSIHFNPKDQSQKIGELLESYSTLQKYCGEAGRVVSEHIDKPFLVEMDKFAQKMRDTSILSFLKQITELALQQRQYYQMRTQGTEMYHKQYRRKKIK